MSTYKITINLKTDGHYDLSEDEMEEIIKHLTELNQWVEVTGITYTN